MPLIRPAGLGALPVPQRVPDAQDALRRLLNVRPGQGGRPSDDFMLAAAWLVAALYPEGPFALLALDGEQGSGKTTAAKMLRRLVDPNTADVQAVPKDERDLVIAARNGRVVALDNLSSLSPEMADALCRLATGSGLGERALFTNGEEHVAYAQNPVLLNGIPSLLARGDLADRAIAITLPAIPDDQRRPEVEVWQDFDAAAPGILALLLDALVLALRDAPGLKLARLPRMADFARVACAAAPAFGWTVEQMLAAMADNRAGAVAGVIEADPIAAAVQAFAAEEGIWQGTASELLEVINRRTPSERQRERDWPKDATRLSGRLRRVAPALRRAGVDLTLPASGGRDGRLITIRTIATQRSERSECSEPSGQIPRAPDRWDAGNAASLSCENAADEVVL
jgi:putative DNA primase/helicase